jgi:hypothetical protein
VARGRLDLHSVADRRVVRVRPEEKGGWLAAGASSAKAWRVTAIGAATAIKFSPDGTLIDQAGNFLNGTVFVALKPGIATILLRTWPK